MGKTKGDNAVRILVTGGAGYLGSVLVPMLLEADYHVTVLDTFMYGNDATMAQYCSHPKFDVQRVDCRDVEAIKPYLKKADVLVPLACLVGAPICNLNPIDAELLNRTSLIELIASMSKDQFIINPSTESVYGKQGTLCTEATTPAPLVSYGDQKLDVERAVEEHGCGVSFRMATLFGMSTRMRLDLMVNDFTWRAVKDMSLVVFEGNAMRTMLHVIDAARAFVHALELAKSGYEVYNLGSIFISKLGLCAAIKEQHPKFYYTEYQFAKDPDARDYTVSDAKIQATGYRPTMTLEAGIKELLVGYRMLANSRHSNMP